ncbi:MAG: hypothetical protein KKD25_10425 [Gammaproteobacteria bacterium]|nr:hypothetical protein [Gammaproteobacteria bacterium]MBU0773407.1 hypothetical protein [Gammaproteobacteria bacterium]MBU0857389.1 hypothetical protein [Gammaproteobacteria bacterium]MBU1846852.1 hypothetical protein [Gammaproteobacteria bacterium]
MIARTLGVAGGLCLVSMVAWSASVKQGWVQPAGESCRQAAKQQVEAAAPFSASVTDVADTHLAWQYALHRSSRYLYNPEREERVAGLADGQTAKQ